MPHSAQTSAALAPTQSVACSSDVKSRSYAPAETPCATHAATPARETALLVAQHAGGSDDLLDFADRDNIGQTLALGRLDQAEGHPRFLQNMGVVELQTVQVEFDGGPGVGADEVGEVVGKLGFGDGVNPVIEVGADPAHGARVGIDGLGLQTFESAMLQVRLILLVKLRLQAGFHLG